MNSRETVIEFVRKLLEELSLPEIAREIELLAGLLTAREQARRREGIPAEDARKLVDAWGARSAGFSRPADNLPFGYGLIMQPS